jgi:hypothetical protein
MLFKATKTIDFPAADTTISVAFIQIHPQSEVSELTIAWNGALPTAGGVQVYILKDGGNWQTFADYVLVTTLTVPGNVSLAGVRGVRVYGFSGTGTGNVDITVVAERRYQ